MGGGGDRGIVEEREDGIRDSVGGIWRADMRAGRELGSGGAQNFALKTHWKLEKKA